MKFIPAGRIAYIQVEDQKHREKLVELYKKLTRHGGDAGLDLFCLNACVVPYDGKRLKVDLGFSMVLADTALSEDSIVEQKTSISYMFLARSSTHKKGIMQCNAVGIIDAGYRGNLMAPVIGMDGNTIIVNCYERLFQVVPFDGKGVDKVIIIEEGQDLHDMFPSDRGTGGFGSTGQ